MTRRSFLYNQLSTDPELMASLADRMFQSSAMTTAKLPKPFLVYHIGNDTSENLTDTHPAHRIFFQVYIHDEIGDYTRIDDLGDRVKELLRGSSSPENGILLTRFLERSQDLKDETFGTIFNYLRFQWILGS